MKPFQRPETHFFICQYMNQTKICLKHVCFSACLSVINCFLSSLSANLSEPFNVLESGLLLCLSVCVYLSSTINCLLTMSLKCWFISLTALCLSVRLSAFSSVWLSTCWSVFPLYVYPPVCPLSEYPPVRPLSLYPTVCLSNSLVTHLSPCLAAWLPIFICVSTVSLPACSPIYLLPAYPSVCLYL